MIARLSYYAPKCITATSLARFNWWTGGRCTRFPVLSAFAVALALSGCAPRRQYEAWWQLGAVQIVEGPTEVWVFAEVERLVLRPEPLVEPTMVSIGKLNKVIVIGPNGKKRSYDLPSADFSFNVNLSLVFRFESQFYALVEGPGRRRRVWQWEDGQFLQVEREASERIIRSLGIVDAEPSAVGGLLDSGTEAAGWHMVCAHNSPITAAIRRCRTNAGIALAVESAAGSEALVARGRADDRAWVAIIVEADTSRKTMSQREFESLYP